jgi:hypothetical protein
MNYCLLEEAWGNKISSTYNKYMNNNINSIEKPIEKPIEKLKIETFENIMNCDQYIIHILSCPECQKKLKDKLCPSIITRLHEIIEKYKDIIVLVLLGIMLILFINLINGLIK